MDLTRYIDGYCERLNPGFWDEPINALTNLAFVIAAFVVWQRHRLQRDWLVSLLCAVLALIGVGSFLFHTTAQVWTAIADVLPILAFILVYIFAINLRVLEVRPIFALLGAALFIPFAAVLLPVFQMVPGLGSSASYGPVPLLILIYAFYLRRAQPRLSREFTIGAGILILSITFRSLDLPLCASVPHGTHFMWHILNAIMLGWMINAYARQMQRPVR